MTSRENALLEQWKEEQENFFSVLFQNKPQLHALFVWLGACFFPSIKIVNSWRWKMGIVRAKTRTDGFTRVYRGVCRGIHGQTVTYKGIHGYTLRDIIGQLSHYGSWYTWYRAFSHDVTAAMLVFQNKGTAAILVYQANPLGIELYFYANTFFCFIKPIWPLVTWVKTLYTPIWIKVGPVIHDAWHTICVW